MKGKVVFGLLAVLLVLCSSASAQTRLQLGANWDNGSSITGTVTLAHNCVYMNGQLVCSVVDYVGQTTGWTTLASFQLVADTLYQVTLVTSNPSSKLPVTLTFPFMLPSGIISPASILAASCRVTIARATNELVKGGMKFDVTI